MKQPSFHPIAAVRAARPYSVWPGLVFRTACVLAVGLVFGGLLVSRLSDISFADVQTALSRVGLGQWLVAGVATLASFWAIGHYDTVIHRYLATDIPAPLAWRAGATAIAVSQTLGLGVITGAIVRWRMLPGHSLWQATRLTSLVAVFFLCGWGIVTAITLSVLPQAPYRAVAVCAAALAAMLILAAALFPGLHRRRLPNLFITARLVALAALDTGMAAVALWALCPPDLALPFATLLPAFLLAFGAGLVSGTPGGVGAFEITLLALLPQVPDAPLLAAVLAWRAVYFAIPAVTGAVVALRGASPAQGAPRRSERSDGHGGQIQRSRIPLETHPARAEMRLTDQGQLTLEAAGDGQIWVTGRTPHCLIGMLDPMLATGDAALRLGCTERAIAGLMARAVAENRLPVIYKCTARTAVCARRAGLILWPVAREGWLDPRSFSLDVPSRSGLRRKLRHAHKNGITVDCGLRDFDQLSQIAAQWARAHGGERGFSMGRFDHAYLLGQRVYVARQSGQPTAFVSFHVGKTEWTLDLMRQTAATPDGTMHALIDRAITDAKALGLARLSLAAVPVAALTTAPRGVFAAQLHMRLGGNQAGLAQFKAAFVPRWQTLYLAAPGRTALAIAGAEIAREVRFPAPLRHPAAICDGPL